MHKTPTFFLTILKTMVTDHFILELCFLTSQSTILYILWCGLRYCPIVWHGAFMQLFLSLFWDRDSQHFRKTRHRIGGNIDAVLWPTKTGLEEFYNLAKKNASKTVCIISQKRTNTRKIFITIPTKFNFRITFRRRLLTQ